MWIQPSIMIMIKPCGDLKKQVSATNEPGTPVYHHSAQHKTGLRQIFPMYASTTTALGLWD